MDLSNNRQIIQEIIYLRGVKGWSINCLYDKFGVDLDIEKILEDHDIKIKRKEIKVTMRRRDAKKRVLTDFDGDKLVNKSYSEILGDAEKRARKLNEINNL